MFELWRRFLGFVLWSAFKMGHCFADIIKQHAGHVLAEPFAYHDTQHGDVFGVWVAKC